VNLNRVKQPAKATSLHTQLHAMHTRAQNTTMKQEISIYLLLILIFWTRAYIVKWA